MSFAKCEHLDIFALHVFLGIVASSRKLVFEALEVTANCRGGMAFAAAVAHH